MLGRDDNLLNYVILNAQPDPVETGTVVTLEGKCGIVIGQCGWLDDGDVTLHNWVAVEFIGPHGRYSTTVRSDRLEMR